MQALLNQQETFYEFNIDIFKDFFTVSSIAKHLLARFSEMYYQYQRTSISETLITGSVVSIKTDNEYIETKIKNYSDSDRKEKKRYIPLTLNETL